MEEGSEQGDTLDMILSFCDLQHRVSIEFGVEFKTCSVDTYYVHGKVEHKIQEIKGLLKTNINNKECLLIIQWEMLGQQITKSIQYAHLTRNTRP